MKKHVLSKEPRPTATPLSFAALFRELRTSVLATLVLAVILCGLYPAIVWGVAVLAFPHQANGSLVERDGKTVGSSLIAQGFVGPRFFHPRPSIAGDGYDATSSGGSNLGPVSQKLIDAVGERVAKYREENYLAPEATVPADAVTASASGLDPHISPRNAELQAARVAKEGGLPEEAVRELIARHTEAPTFGFLGEPRVNVLELNLELTALEGKRDGSGR